ncbi:hypothetical protein RPC_3663 [Rhodopseudomonas palustris BisB18]|uniref:Uncharacterized protein n=1 Tax=Rhodopseudomonas palustris (strain BisB18) TaxID=316056 RepID=Q210I8_RHOPB
MAAAAPLTTPRCCDVPECDALTRIVKLWNGRGTKRGRISRIALFFAFTARSPKIRRGVAQHLERRIGRAPRRAAQQLIAG